MTSTQEHSIYSINYKKQFIEVVDQKPFRSLYFGNRTLQSRYDKTAPTKLVLRYPGYMMSSLLLKKTTPKQILLIGIGGGSLITFLHHHFPHCKIEGVDNNPCIIQIARDYFRLPQSPNITIYCDDGLTFLNRQPATKLYDLILLDAFSENGMVPGIFNQQFFQNCKNRLTKNGIMTCNLWSGKHALLQKVQKELRGVFPSNLYIPVRNRGNVVSHSMTTSIPWKQLKLSKTELDKLEEKFKLDFSQIIDQLTSHNSSNWQRLLFFLQKYIKVFP